MDYTITVRMQQIVDELFNGNKSEFARTIGVSESVIRSYVHGTIPKADVLEKIASNLEISCEWLLIGKGKMKSFNNDLSKQFNESSSLDDMVDKFIDLLKKRDEQIDRLLSLLETEHKK